MDPNIWGPKLWNIIYDVGYMCEHYSKGRPVPRVLETAIGNLFESFQYLLPCIYCRQSYKTYYQKNFHNTGPPIGPGALRWVYRLKDLVNKKLGKKSIPFYEFKNRMDTWASASCDGDVLRILFMFGKNIYVNSNEVTIQCKKQWYKKMWAALIRVMKEIPNKRNLVNYLRVEAKNMQRKIGSQKQFNAFLERKLIKVKWK